MKALTRSIALAVLAAAVVRLLYVLTDTRWLIGGDGLCYHVEGLLLADGKGFTSCFPGQEGAPTAHHPPLWFGLLGVVSMLGARSVFAHQLVTMAVGLVVVAMCGLVGRRYFGDRAGMLAAWIAALYPGFWVLEAQILAEPLGLALTGVLALLVADLRDRPSLGRALAAGAMCGLCAMVRSELLALWGVVVVALLLPLRARPYSKRVALAALSILPCAAVIAPWVIFNNTRFAEPVLLSSNGGGTLLAGNCPPRTYYGNRIGYYDVTCDLELGMRNPGLDRSQLDRLSYEAARRNMTEHRDAMPRVVAARLGRLFAVFEPAATVRWTARWMLSAEWPVWAWVVSYWLLFPIALAGAVSGIRHRLHLSPFLIPLMLCLGISTVFYGEPRYHTPSDLGVVVLAAATIGGAFTARRRAPAG